MGHVRVHGADLEDGRIRALRVEILGLPARVIDRETAIHWLREGHSLVPMIGGAESTGLQLVEVAEGEGSARYVRNDNAAVAQDALPPLPRVGQA